MVETKIIKYLPLSFVADNIKNAEDVAADKLFVGPLSQESELDNFFEFSTEYTYYISKSNFRDYLLQVKFEYVYHKFNSYRNTTLETWNNNLKLVDTLPASTINIDLVKFTDKSGYYVRSETTEFKKLLRSIILPKITDLVFIKDTLSKTVHISLELNLSCDQSNTVSEIDPPVDLEHSLITYKTGIQSEYARNRIVFGAPGTGKSFLINNERVKLLETFGVGDDHYERVTFHPDYSYANFVGTYKPVMIDNKLDTFDDETKYVLKTLTDQTTTAQIKYDSLFKIFNNSDNRHDSHLGCLSILVGISSDEAFSHINQKGESDPKNTLAKNEGRYIRKYVKFKSDKKDDGGIAYKYVPGPFMRMYSKALKNAQNVVKGTEEARPFLLIIEEINRANVAAVFGDVFQLLDRKNNISEYPIQASEDIKNYLAKELGGNPDDYAKIKIPDNMFIWATMNSADQGVLPMDTAFKRRWDFEYIGINNGDEEIADKCVVLGENKERIVWNSLRKAINDYLAKSKINEDKQLGPSFISRDIVAPNESDEIDSSAFSKVFKNKVIMYLFEDAAKQKRQALFSGAGNDCYRYSQICEAFDVKGIGIFCNDVLDNYRKIEEERKRQIPNKSDGES
ncbi:MAG: hypothetical protein VZR11_09730 [Succinimonas sp.]|nr:hypothetical protein [Succinimonas sp.]